MGDGLVAVGGAKVGVGDTTASVGDPGVGVKATGVSAAADDVGASVAVANETSKVAVAAGGVLFAKLINVFLSKDGKINPCIGAAGVSAVPMAARFC